MKEQEDKMILASDVLSVKKDSPRAVETIDSSYVDLIDKYKFRILLGSVALILGLLYYALTLFSALQPNGLSDPTSESTITNNLFRSRYVAPSPDIFAIVSHPSWKPTDLLFKDAYFSMKATLKQKISDAKSFASYFEYPNYPGTLSKDGYKAIISFRLPDASKYTLSDFQNAVVGSPLIIHFGGSEMATQEIPTQLSKDLASIEMGSVPVLIALLVTLVKNA